MKRTAVGPLLGFGIFALVAGALAQAPSGSARPGKGFGPHPGPSGGVGHPHRPGSAAAPHGSAPPGSASPASSGGPGGIGRGLQHRMMERLATLKTRRHEHVQKLKSRFSELHLKSEALRNELRRHARSLAFLERARMIAEEELTDPKKAKVLKRIDVLLAKEQARHDRHVARFTAAGAPSGSGPPSASGFVPPRAPSAAGPAGSGAPKRLPPQPATSAGGAQ